MVKKIKVARALSREKRISIIKEMVKSYYDDVKIDVNDFPDYYPSDLKITAKNEPFKLAKEFASSYELYLRSMTDSQLIKAYQDFCFDNI